QALLEVVPGHTEGNLRLAHLELMDGQERRARKLLLRAIESDGPDWALAVAYQELARLHIDDGELLDAKKVLGAALERLPDQPRLLMLLAFAHDASAANGRAREVLGRAVATSTSRPSPRHRFVDWSRESFVRNDRQVQEEVNGSLPVLTDRWQRVRNHQAQALAQGESR
ncbi:MAG: hypothetical protein AAGF23_03645, partial [Acidobacteriota bacterium]